MVPLAALWLPILVSGVVVFLASWIVHMLLPHHRSDFQSLHEGAPRSVCGFCFSRWCQFQRVFELNRCRPLRL